jgi:ribosomal protein S18 acetylase RimI-like enzyme
MQIRPATSADVTFVNDIDATVESGEYVHVDRAGDGLGRSWRLEVRPLREKLVRAGPIGEDELFAFRQIATGADEGLALVAEHDGAMVALLVAQVDPSRRTLQLLDLRVDYDFRRQGLATALLFAAIGHARERELRAVAAESVTDNLPAAALLTKSGFEIAGLDDRRQSNHDLVKERVTLFWYAVMD